MHRIIYMWTNIKFHLTLFFTVNPTKESNKIPNSYIEILAESSYYNNIIFCVFFVATLFRGSTPLAGCAEIITQSPMMSIAACFQNVMCLRIIYLV